MPTLTGQTLGRYQLHEPLGEGGMATVYKAHDTRLETDVAVKIIRTETLPQNAVERALKRFEREAKALAKLTHPNIIPIMDYGEHEGHPYLVMKYLPGGTLKQKLNGKPIPWQDAARLLVPVARALDYAHRQGMIHRDVKPSNILITEDGEPMLTDFGIAKIIDEEATVDLTGTSATVGSPEYMAPEQVISKAVDHRADVYALGVVFYEMVTGCKPFQADTPMAVLFKHASEPLPRPGQFVKDLPESVESVLLKMLAKRPDERYTSMGEVAKVLEEFAFAGIPPRAGNAETKGEGLPTPMQVTLVDDQATVDQFEGPVILDERVGAATPATVLQPEAASLSNEKIILLGDGVEMAFVRVPAGKFWMGSPEGVGSADEHPRHEVYLDEYWMGKTPVTNRQYRRLVVASGRDYPEYWERGNIPDGKEEHPVVEVTWKDAFDFCAWLGKMSGESIRLPSEAEWEKAARGTDERIYPWGNEQPTKRLCNFGSLFWATSAVGNYSPQGDSPYGCVDMAGNVWEWMNDWYDSDCYAHSLDRDPLGPSMGNFRVVRGGSWYSNDSSVRSSNRDWYGLIYSDDIIGFRCACSKI